MHPLDHLALLLHTTGTMRSPDNWFSGKRGGPKHLWAVTHFILHRCTWVHVRYSHGNGAKETEMWQKTTETQQSDKATRTMAHLGIWLSSRHWGSGHPSLLCTFSTHRGGGGDRKESGYSAGLNVHTNRRVKRPGLGTVGGCWPGSNGKENSPQTQYLIKSVMLETVFMGSAFTCARFPTCKIRVFHNLFLNGK